MCIGSTHGDVSRLLTCLFSQYGHHHKICLISTHTRLGYLHFVYAPIRTTEFFQFVSCRFLPSALRISKTFERDFVEFDYARLFVDRLANIKHNMNPLIDEHLSSAKKSINMLENVAQWTNHPSIGSCLRCDLMCQLQVTERKNWFGCCWKNMSIQRRTMYVQSRKTHACVSEVKLMRDESNLLIITSRTIFFHRNQHDKEFSSWLDIE